MELKNIENNIDALIFNTKNDINKIVGKSMLSLHKKCIKLCKNYKTVYNEYTNLLAKHKELIKKSEYHQEDIDNLNSQITNYISELHKKNAITKNLYQLIEDSYKFLQISESSHNVTIIKLKKEILNKSDQIHSLLAKSTCTICYQNKINILFYPCGHQCCCSVCSDHVNLKCPICREYIDEKIPSYLPY